MKALPIDLLAKRLWRKDRWPDYLVRWKKPAANLSDSKLSGMVALTGDYKHNHKITYRHRNAGIREVYKERKKLKRMRLHAYRNWFKIFPK